MRSGVEIVEIQQAGGKAVERRMQDSGAGGGVISTGGATVDLPGRGGAVTKTSIARSK